MPNSNDQRCKCHHKASLHCIQIGEVYIRLYAYASLMRLSSVEVRHLEIGCGQL